MAIPNLFQALKITGDRGAVVGPIFVRDPAFALAAKEIGDLVLSDLAKQVAALL